MYQGTELYIIYFGENLEDVGKNGNRLLATNREYFFNIVIILFWSNCVQGCSSKVDRSSCALDYLSGKHLEEC